MNNNQISLKTLTEVGEKIGELKIPPIDFYVIKGFVDPTSPRNEAYTVWYILVVAERGNDDNCRIVNYYPIDYKFCPNKAVIYFWEYGLVNSSFTKDLKDVMNENYKKTYQLYFMSNGSINIGQGKLMLKSTDDINTILDNILEDIPENEKEYNICENKLAIPKEVMKKIYKKHYNGNMTFNSFLAALREKGIIITNQGDKQPVYYCKSGDKRIPYIVFEGVAEYEE